MRRLHSPDVPDLSAPVGIDPADFHMLVQAMVGPRGEAGEESFDIEVCTPTWLARKVARDGALFGRYFLIVPRYDVQAIEDAISGLCTTLAGDTWNEVAEHLASYAKWEFEDYRECAEEPA